jgi:sodium/hydrogen antiporter
VYLAAGLVLGPSLLGVFRFDPVKQSSLLEVLTEIAVLISLFSAGVKMPVPVTWRRWGPPVRLAWVSMTITVALMAAFGYWVLGLPLGAAVLLGGILAPTDPVLATDVQVRHAGDDDELRFALTCEAGMNDGSAFPFVMLGLGLLGLHDLGEFGVRWVAVDVVWATLGAIAIGVIGGTMTARVSWRLRSNKPRHEVLDDLVGLGLIAVVYAITVSVHAWGFLAVFFAGVALRQTELQLVGAPRDREGMLESDMSKSEFAHTSKHHEAPMIVSGESLIFKEHLERLSELTLVLLLGGMLTVAAWNWKVFATAAFLFIVARPVSVFIGLVGTGLKQRVKGITGWFGVRGIGSIYYLMFAINHGVPAGLTRELTQITLVAIVLSIVAHGTSVKPLMDKFWPARQRDKRMRE